MKSMCQDARRNSPSVAVCRPASSCRVTTSAIAASSISLSLAAAIRPAATAVAPAAPRGAADRLEPVAVVRETAMSGGVGNLVASGPLILAVPVALAAGAGTFLSPCCLPLVPGYLSYVTGMSGTDASQAAGVVPAALPGKG